MVPKEGDKSILPFANGLAKLGGKGSEFRTSDRIRSKREKNTEVIFKEKRTNRILQFNNKNKMIWKQNLISGVFLEAFIYRQHVREVQKLCMPQESSFLIPLKYMDVVRRTNTTWDVLQEGQIDDCGTLIMVIGGNYQGWDRFHQVHHFAQWPTSRIHVVWGEVDKDPSNVQARVQIARSLVVYVKEISPKRKISIGQKRRRSSTMHAG